MFPHQHLRDARWAQRLCYSVHSSVETRLAPVEYCTVFGREGGKAKALLVEETVFEGKWRIEKQLLELVEAQKEEESGQGQYGNKKGKSQLHTELSKMGCPRLPSRSTLAVLISELANCSLLALLDPDTELRPASLSL